MKKARQLIFVLLAGTMLCVNLAGGLVLAADSESEATAETTTEVKEVKEATGKTSVGGYASDAPLQYGTIVRLTEQDAKRVTPASGKDLSKMHGVTVDPHQLSVTLSDSSLQNEVYVATSGAFNVLVSTQNGVIREGDYITMSSIDGVAMKAGVYEEHAMVFGQAAAGFDGKSSSIGTKTLSYEGGSGSETVQLGLIPVAVNIVRNPNDKSTEANLPPLLERVGKVIAERQVSPFRIYLSIVVAGLCVVVALVVLYSGVKNAVISIGRNPLTKKSIFRGLLEVILTGFLILVIGLFAVYLLLKL